MKGPAMKWLVLSLFCAIAAGMLAAGSLVSPLIMESDPYGLLRYMLLRLAAVALAAPALIGLMLAVDFITPGDWMDAIAQDPKACSYIMAAVVLVIGGILCWT
jgi:hypothetical protein